MLESISLHNSKAIWIFNEAILELQYFFFIEERINKRVNEINSNAQRYFPCMRSIGIY